MDEQNNKPEQKIDQDKLGVWIGVTIIVLVGVGLVAYGLYMAANPGATMLIVP
ncbi:hypothetical protein ACFL0Z_02935 [Patescibacteria group bacterium]